MSKVIRSNLLPEKLQAELNIRKSDFYSPVISNSTEKFEASKKFLGKSIILSTSPYAIKQVRSLKSLENSKSKQKLLVTKKNRLFNEGNKSFYKDSRKKINSYSFFSTEDPTRIESKDLSIVGKIHEMIMKIESTQDKFKKFEIVQGLFNEVIEKDKDFSFILKLIKSEYEKLVKSQQSDLEKYEKQIQEGESVKVIMSEELEKLFYQNKEINSKYDELYKKYIEVSDKAIKVERIGINTLEKTEENWKRILQENHVYEETLYDNKKEIAYYKRKVKKMLKLLQAIEKKGYPLEQIYFSDVKKKKLLPRYEGDDLEPDDTENEALVSGKLKTIRCPEVVPMLNLSLIEPSSDESESDQDSSEVVESSEND